MSKQYTSIREPFQEYTNWLINLLNSLLVELDIKTYSLTHIIISIIDGIIIDGTIDKDLIDPSKKWQYIEYLIKTEKSLILLIYTTNILKFNYIFSIIKLEYNI